MSSLTIIGLVLSDNTVVYLGDVSQAEGRVPLINAGLTREKIGLAEKLPVSDLNIKGRMQAIVFNGLEARNIKTIGDLLKITERELMKATRTEKTPSGLSVLGIKSINCINDELKKLGVWIGILAKH